MSIYIEQLRSLLGGLSYYRKFLPNMARRIRPITTAINRRYVQVYLSNRIHRSCPSRRTHITADLPLPSLERGHCTTLAAQTSSAFILYLLSCSAPSGFRPTSHPFGLRRFSAHDLYRDSCTLTFRFRRIAGQSDPRFSSVFGRPHGPCGTRFWSAFGL